LVNSSYVEREDQQEGGKRGMVLSHMSSLLGEDSVHVNFKKIIGGGGSIEDSFDMCQSIKP